MSELEAAIEKRRMQLEQTAQDMTQYDTSAEGAAASDEWVLYYSEDGYPYYYNAATGESYWAESTADTLSAAVEETTPVSPYTGAPVEQGEYDDDEEEEEEEEEEDSGSEYGSSYASDSESGSDSDSSLGPGDSDSPSGSDEGGSEVETSGKPSRGQPRRASGVVKFSRETKRGRRPGDRFDDRTEEKFLEYLKTEGGKALLEKEQARVQERLDERKERGAGRAGRRAGDALTGAITKLLPAVAPFIAPSSSSASGKEYQRPGRKSPPVSANSGDNGAGSSLAYLANDLSLLEDTETAGRGVLERGRDRSLKPSRAGISSAPAAEGDTSSSGGDLSDDSDIDEIETPDLPEWMQWKTISEATRAALAKTVGVGNQLVRGNLSAVDVNLLTQYALVVLSTVGTGVARAVSTTAACVSDPESVLPPAVFQLLNTNVTLTLPSSLSMDRDGTEDECGEDEDEGEAGAERVHTEADLLSMLQTGAASAGTAAASLVGRGVSSAAAVVWNHVNARLQTIVDSVDASTDSSGCSSSDSSGGGSVVGMDSAVSSIAPAAPQVPSPLSPPAPSSTPPRPPSSVTAGAFVPSAQGGPRPPPFRPPRMAPPPPQQPAAVASPVAATVTSLDESVIDGELDDLPSFTLEDGEEL